MVKHIQTIRRQLPTNCLSVFDHFVGLALKGLRSAIFSSNVYLIRVMTEMSESFRRLRKLPNYSRDGRQELSEKVDDVLSRICFLVSYKHISFMYKIPWDSVQSGHNPLLMYYLCSKNVLPLDKDLAKYTNTKQLKSSLNPHSGLYFFRFLKLNIA